MFIAYACSFINKLSLMNRITPDLSSYNDDVYKVSGNRRNCDLFVFETVQHDWFIYNLSWIKSLLILIEWRSPLLVFGTFACTCYYNCYFNFPNSSICFTRKHFQWNPLFYYDYDYYIFITQSFETFTGTCMFTWSIFHYLACALH